MESKISEMCQLSFQYHILKMNGHPTSTGEPVAILAVFMIEIHGERILNRPKPSRLHKFEIFRRWDKIKAGVSYIGCAQRLCTGQNTHPYDEK